MRISKHGHACVRIEHEGSVLVIDPGLFTDPAVLDGARAVLITHEHIDHCFPAHLEDTDAPVWTIDAVAAKLREEAPATLERTTVVHPGQTFVAADIQVTSVGDFHAEMHPDYPADHNSGYRLEVADKVLFHPGDAIDQIQQDVDVLFLPVSAPWARSSELIEFARAVGAPMSVAIHDQIFSEAGSGLFDSMIKGFLEPEELGYVRPADGQDI